MLTQKQKLQELKAKIHNPQAAAQMREQLKKQQSEREPFNLDALKEYTQSNPAFQNLHITADED